MQNNTELTQVARVHQEYHQPKIYNKLFWVAYVIGFIAVISGDWLEMQSLIYVGIGSFLVGMLVSLLAWQHASAYRISSSWYRPVFYICLVLGILALIASFFIPGDKYFFLTPLILLWGLAAKVNEDRFQRAHPRL